ncbi:MULTISPECIES: hypothetical protein [Bacteroidota]|uniref:Muconolactone isomerase domain-containing protein n=1 Tax=Flectobacillus rivi TaxID=2984209 RepID=A0ABT6YVY6_9BACT|nr:MULTISPECIES: hypothetical protein [Bacteroidota]MDI9873045.1 hypothetical protein [Flectobacillus rivi]
MYRIIVSIALSDSGIDTIKSTPELPKKEMEYVNLWKTEGILESFYISVTKKEAVLIFKDIDEAKCKEMIEILPYFPYMSKIEYLGVDKQF